MRSVIRKGSLRENLFLTASRRWGRLDKAQPFTEKQVGEVADRFGAKNFGIFDLSHARNMVESGRFCARQTGARQAQGD